MMLNPRASNQCSNEAGEQLQGHVWYACQGLPIPAKQATEKLQLPQIKTRFWYCNSLVVNLFPNKFILILPWGGGG